MRIRDDADAEANSGDADAALTRWTRNCGTTCVGDEGATDGGREESDEGVLIAGLGQ
jgi:hypothetical protein